ncbi:MAG: pectate lyase, partial [Planctomycetota bacterium]
MRRFRATCLAPVLVLAPFTAALAARAAPSREEAGSALRRAVAFFRAKVAVRGGYLWRYSADLSKREGEGKVGESTAWVQPPGTPFVGEALVDAYELSGERVCLDAARESAMALVGAQLHSGGWPYRIEFEPAARRRFAYRVDGKPSRKARNVSVLDDDTTQSALRFLMKYDRATRFADAPVHEAALRGLTSLLDAQFPNGGWAQVYRGPAARGRYPVKRAGYRPDGKHTRVKAYWEFCTLNDNLMRDAIETLFLAARVYDEERYREAAMKGGDFLILAQMPEPQPGWAQQYDFDMHPCWARKFEPASITGGESQGVMMTLLDIYERTGERKYLEPIPRALAYYRRS